MPIVEKKILLDAARDEVWNFIVSPGHFGEYVAGYTHGEMLTEAAAGLDSAFRWKAALGPVQLSCEEKVVEWAENEKVAYEGGLAGGTFHSEMRLRAVGSGTELTVSVKYDAPFGPAGRVLDGLFLRRAVESHVADSLDNLRAVFEGAGGPRGSESGGTVRSVYSMWGRTGLYDASAAVTFLFRENQIRRRAVERLELRRGGRALDICCGTGLNLPHLVRRVGPEGGVIGLDYTRAMLDRAEKRRGRHGWSNVDLVQGDAARLCFPDAHFDGVISVLGISAVADFKAAVSHAVRVCKEGGRVVVCDGHPFRGTLEPLNAVMVPLYRRLSCWDHGKDIIGEMEKRISGVRVEWFNGGSIYIASGIKKSSARR